MFETSDRPVTTVQLPRSELTRNFKGVATIVFVSKGDAEATAIDFAHGRRADGVSAMLKCVPWRLDREESYLLSRAGKCSIRSKQR